MQEKISAIPPKDTLDVSKLFESASVTTTSRVEPKIVPDPNNSSFYLFQYPNVPSVRSALEDYTLNRAINIRDFERTFMRLRNLLHQARSARR